MDSLKLMRMNTMLLLFPMTILFMAASIEALLFDEGRYSTGNGADGFKSSYSRISEAIKSCPSSTSSWISSQQQQNQEEGPDPKWVVQNELSFQNGDWSAREELLPFIPFTDAQLVAADPVRLASMWITDVKSKKNVIRVSSILMMAVTMHRGISYYTAPTEGFSATPGFTVMTALMEGVYYDNSHERGLCMVGCTMVPVSANVTTETTRNCDISLQMHYPKVLSLRSRVVQGELRIGKVRVTISTQLGPFSKYEFLQDGSSCNPKPQLALPLASVYHGARFCSALMQVVSGQWIDLITSSSSTKAGPFEFGNVPLSGSNSSRFQLRIQDIRCAEFDDSESDQQKANVSAVLRIVPPGHDPVLASERSGLADGLAFAAEGVFEASTGRLCMVGCTNESSCTVVVTIVVPLAFSLTQRYSVVGEISSLNGDFNTSYFNLLASLQSLPLEVEAAYTYSKIGLARKIANRDGALEPGIKDKLRLALLKYPTLGDGYSMVQLGQDLSVRSSIVPARDGSGDRLRDAVFVMNIVAVEDVILQSRGLRREQPDGTSSNKEVVKVAASLQFQDASDRYTVIPAMSVEGVYVSEVGKMYMVGCRRANSSASTVMVLLTKSPSGEDLDCEIQVVVQVPPLNAQWLVNPTVEVQVSSTRAKKDGLFFEPIRFQTYPVLYSDQRKEIVSRKTLEAVLSAITLSLMILCVALQLVYVKRVTMVESVPFISLVMLVVQAFGYSIPLITGVEALFSRLAFGAPTSDSEAETTVKDGEVSVIVLYLVKLLSLGAFLLVLRLCQKVVRSRIRLAIKFPLEPRRVPSEKKTLKIYILIHVVGFCVVLLFHYILVGNTISPTWQGRDLQEETSRGQVFMKELKEYVGLVQDLFLLPQVIAISMWEIKGKPLRRSYYMGITSLRLLPHMYHAARRPWFNPYFAEEYSVYANPKQDFYNRAGDFFIPLLAIGMAGAVYAQQRWNALRWVKVIRTGSSKLLRYGSKLYERLPSKGLDRKGSSKNFEAELMPSIVPSEEQ